MLERSQCGLMLLVAASLLGWGCSKKQPPAVAEKPAAAPQVAAPRAVAAKAPAAPPKTLPAEQKSYVPTELPETTKIAENAVLAPVTEGGAVLVWALNSKETPKSEIVGRLLDESGAPAGPPRHLQWASGQVLKIAAAVHGERLWIAWLASVPADQEPDEPDASQTAAKNKSKREVDADAPSRYLVKALRVQRDLGGADDHPITVRRMRRLQAGLDPDPYVELGVEEDGTVRVFAPGPPGRCTYTNEGMADKGEMPPDELACGALLTTRLTPAGQIKDRNEEHLIGQFNPPHEITTVPGGFVWIGPSDSKGPETDGPPKLLEQLNSTPETPKKLLPKDTFFEAKKEYSYYLTWTGTALVALASIEGGAINIWVSPLDAKKPLTAKAKAPELLAQKTRCVEGRPVTRLRFKGGEIDIDPGNKGASPRLSGFLEKEPAGFEGTAYWLGRAAAGVDGGKLFRWRCEEAELRPIR